MKYLIPGIIACFVAFFPSCMSQQNIDGSLESGFDLNKPESKYSLPAELTEISGIICLQEKIFCIQDESSDIFVFDPLQKQLIATYNNGVKGDFEDLVILGTDAFILKSNGTIIRVNEFNNSNRKIVELDTPLSAENDTEGLAYDSVTNSLLIACKGIGDKDVKKNYKGIRSFYRFSLESNTMIPQPYFSLDLQNPENYVSKEVFERFRLLEEQKPGVKDFRPSALAFHSGDLYIISSTGRLLLVLNKDLKIKDFCYLSPEVFSQPEGLTFSEKGDMYISNEGRNGPGYILLFRE